MAPTEPISTMGTNVNVMPPVKHDQPVPSSIANVQPVSFDFSNPEEMHLKLKLVGAGAEPVLPRDWTDGAVISASHVTNIHGDVEIDLVISKFVLPEKPVEAAPVKELPPAKTEAQKDTKEIATA